MKKIEFYKSIFTPEETNSLADHVLISLNGGNNDENLLKGITELYDVNSYLTKILNTSLSNPYTQKMRDDNDWRDSIFVGGRFNVKSYTYFKYDTVKQEAAEKVFEVFERHGIDLHRFSYQKQSSSLGSFIKDLSEAEMQAQLAALQLTTWMQELVKAHEQSETTFNLKASYKNGKESLAKRDAQIPVNDKLENLFTYLNATIIFNSEDPVWLTILNDIEGIVNQVTTNSRIRRSLQNNKPEEENADE